MTQGNPNVTPSSFGKPTILKSTPPIFTGFEKFAHNDDGFFIINPADGSIFKWIDVEALESNGQFYKRRRFSKGGRRNFSGTVFNCFNHVYGKGYYESDDTHFKKCVEKYGGFYIAICRARINTFGSISFSRKGEPVTLIDSSTAKREAKKYAAKFAVNNEFISRVPCGAAFDCVFESIFERFRKEVMDFKEPDELAYDAWNRYEATVREKFLRQGVYGMFDFFYGSDITSEYYGSKYCSVYRSGLAYGLNLIAHNEREKRDLTASFPLGHRNFTSASAKWIDHGYRIVLLPKEI